MENYFSNISTFDKDIVKREKEYDQHWNKNDMFKCTNFEDPDPGIHPASTGVALSLWPVNAPKRCAEEKFLLQGSSISQQWCNGCQTLQLFLKTVEPICFFPTS